MAACCSPVDGFETVPGRSRPNAGDLGSQSGLAQSKIPPRTRGERPDLAGVVLKKVAPAYLSRPTAAPTRRKTAE